MKRKSVNCQLFCHSTWTISFHTLSSVDVRPVHASTPPNSIQNHSFDKSKSPIDAVPVDGLGLGTLDTQGAYPALETALTGARLISIKDVGETRFTAVSEPADADRLTAPTAAANVDGTSIDESAATTKYTVHDADTGQKLDYDDDGDDDTVWNTKTTAIAGQSSLGGVTCRWALPR